MNNEQIQELVAKISELQANVQQLIQRVETLESGSIGTGVYLDGCPEYATDYIRNSIKKEGE
jgi:cell division protein FtsB